VLGHEAANQGLFENNNIKKQEINTHIFRLATPVSGVLPSNSLAASEVTCAEVRKSQRRGVRGDFAYLHIAAEVVFATAVHSVDRKRVARLRSDKRGAKLRADAGATAQSTQTYAQRISCSWRFDHSLEVSTK
jgi:hypothetical protein